MIPNPSRSPISVAYNVAALIVVACIAGCAANVEQLVPVRNAVPDDVDLSGRWRMQDDVAAMRERIDDAIRRTDGVDERDLLRGMTGTAARQDGRRRRSNGREAGGLVHVFLENDERLRVTQTDSGLFIAFGRSVVEEYRFGEARMVQTGGAAAQRVSGWDGRAYRIETLDRTGMKLTERYTLEASGNRLVREIRLRSADLATVSIVQTFVRQ